MSPHFFPPFQKGIVHGGREGRVRRHPDRLPRRTRNGRVRTVQGGQVRKNNIIFLIFLLREIPVPVQFFFVRSDSEATGRTAAFEFRQEVQNSFKNLGDSKASVTC